MKIKINEKLPDSEVFQLINDDPVKFKIYSLFSKKKDYFIGNAGSIYISLFCKTFAKFYQSFKKVL